MAPAVQPVKSSVGVRPPGKTGYSPVDGRRDDVGVHRGGHQELGSSIEHQFCLVGVDHSTDADVRILTEGPPEIRQAVDNTGGRQREFDQRNSAGQQALDHRCVCVRMPRP